MFPKIFKFKLPPEKSAKIGIFSKYHGEIIASPQYNPPTYGPALA